MSVDYHPGPRLLVAVPGLAVLTDDQPLARRVWSMAADARPVEDLLVELLRGGLADLPSFVLVDRRDGQVRVLVRGDVTVRVGSPDSVAEWTGVGVTTWAERAFDGHPTVVVGELAPDEERLPLGCGIVRCAGFRMTGADGDGGPLDAVPAVGPVTAGVPAAAGVSAAARAKPDRPATPWTLSKPIPPEASGPEAAAGPSSSPVPEPGPAPAPTSAPEWAWSASVGAPSDADPAVPSAASSSAASPVVEPGVVGELAAPPAWPEEPSEARDEPREKRGPMLAAPPSPTPTPDPAQTRTDGIEDGFDHLFESTIVRSVEEAAIRDLTDEEPSAVRDAFGEPVELHRLGDHDGHTITAAELGALRQQIPTAEPQAAPPAGARLEISTGTVVVLDRDVVIGRRPEVDRVQGGRVPAVVTVPSPRQDVSRTHLRVGWSERTVLVTDLHSMNGTVLTGAGGISAALTGGVPHPLADGDVLDIGDGITVTLRFPASPEPA